MCVCVCVSVCLCVCVCDDDEEEEYLSTGKICNWRCATCGCTFKQKSSLNRHQLQKSHVQLPAADRDRSETPAVGHGRKRKEPPVVAAVEISAESDEVWGKRKQQNEHNQFKCPVDNCGKHYSSISSLREHQRTQRHWIDID